MANEEVNNGRRRFLTATTAVVGAAGVAGAAIPFFASWKPSANPVASDSVKVHYRGTLADGKEFDSSYKRGEPTAFPLNRVISGWTEGLQLMKEGGKSILYIPYSLGYGANGAPGAIPPYAALIFEVELISFSNASSKEMGAGANW